MTEIAVGRLAVAVMLAAKCIVWQVLHVNGGVVARNTISVDS